jgi:hypothetical protein
VAARDANRGGDFAGRSRPADCDGLPLADTGIASVERELERLGTRAGRTERVAEVSQQRVVVSDPRSLPSGYRSDTRANNPVSRVVW